MKVLLHYEDNEDNDLYKSLKITLPKSWKIGPTQKLLEQFVESYNAAFEKNQLSPAEMHLAVRKTVNGKSQMVALPSDAVVVEVITDYADVYVQHGPAFSMEDQKAKEEEERKEKQKRLESTVPCTHFGCKNRFPKGGPYPECTYHKSPPVFHETAKFWSCCPHKKAYDWETFQEIPGCQKGTCTDVKESSDQQKMFLGGTDLREQMAGVGEKLKSIDDFNKVQAAGGATAAPVLERLRNVMVELGIEPELFEQVVNGIQSQVVASSGSSASDPEILESVKAELGNKLKTAMKNLAAEQLRIS
ncbi:hypothetical protein ACA910_010803 [Epithemia clementina (nom. ined.)]